MTKHSRLITALLALIFCFSALTAFSAPVLAESQISEGGETPAENPDPITPEPDPVTPDPVTPDPVTPDPVTPDPVTPDPVTPDPVTPDPVTPGGGSDSGNSGGSSDDGGSSYSDSGNTPVYYDSDGNEHTDQSDVYVGGGQSYDPPVSTAPSVAPFKTQNNIDVNELSKNDWNDIKKSLEKASKGGVSDGDDFSFIQKNTAKEDNGHVVLVIGIAMVILSLAGFTYLIISTVMRRKKITAGGVSPTSGSHSAAAQRYRGNSDYDDGYSKASKKASKFDTADIPNVKAKSKGGRRYK